MRFSREGGDRRLHIFTIGRRYGQSGVVASRRMAATHKVEPTRHSIRHRHEWVRHVQEVDDDGDLHVVAACLGADSVDLVAVAVDQDDPVAEGSRLVVSLMTWAMTSAASSTTLMVSHFCSALGGAGL